MLVAGCGFWVAKLQVVISGSGQVSLYAVAVCLLWIIALWGAGYWLQVSVLVALALDGLPILTWGQNVPPEGGSLYGLVIAGVVWLLVAATA